jgi:hypothetical protein
MNDAERSRCLGSRRVRVAMAAMALAFSAALGAKAHAKPPDVDKPAADVTITVVEDADKLNQVVNNISLPPGDKDEAQVAAERARERKHAMDKEKSDARDAAKDAHDARQETRDAIENQKDPD